MSRKKPRRKSPAAAESAASSGDPLRAWLLAAMAMLLVARPLYPSELCAVEGDGLPVVMLWLALAVIWLVSVVHQPHVALRFGAIDAAVIALLGWVAAAALFGAAHGSPRPSLNALWEWVGLGTIYFLARQWIVSPRETRAVVAAMIALLTAISAYGIYQYAVELPDLQRQFKAAADLTLHDAGLSYPSGTPIRDLLEKRLAHPALTGTFAESNSLAADLAPWLAIGAGILLGAWWNRRYRFAWIACLAPMAAALALTKSRSGAIAAGVGIVWLVARRLIARSAKPQARRIAAALTCAALSMVVVLYAVHNRPWFVRAATSFGFRVQYWQATAEMIRQHPWLGCGPGNFQDYYTQFKLPQASEEVADPHNFLLEIWATAGTPALAAFLAVLAIFIGQAVRNSAGWTSESADAMAREESDPSHRNDHSKLVPFGAAAGFLLALLMRQICSTPPSIAATLIGLPAAAACLFLLRPWVRGGQFPRGLAGLGVVVLLIDLLTTEGIGIPGIAEMLWLLLAIWSAAIYRRFPAALRPFGNDKTGDVLVREESGDESPHSKLAPRWAVAALLAFGVALTLACYETSYARVLPCQAAMRRARLNYLDGELTAARAAAESAVKADPLSSDAQSFLSQVDLDLWLASEKPADYEAFQRSDALARQLAPHSVSVWQASAARYQKAFAKTDSHGRRLAPSAIDEALASSRRAVELYPGSSFGHATLATLYEQSGDAAAYRREARAALDLDDIMVHEDKKLPPDLRRKLEAAVHP